MIMPNAEMCWRNICEPCLLLRYDGVLKQNIPERIRVGLQFTDNLDGEPYNQLTWRWRSDLEAAYSHPVEYLALGGALLLDNEYLRDSRLNTFLDLDLVRKTLGFKVGTDHRLKIGGAGTTHSSAYPKKSSSPMDHSVLRRRVK